MAGVLGWIFTRWGRVVVSVTMSNASEGVLAPQKALCDLHRLPSCVCVTPQKAWARMRADLPNSASEGADASEGA